MKTFIKYNDMAEKEKLFLELAHLDELEIKFSFIRHKYNIFYYYKKNWFFYLDKKNKDFWINYDKIWLVFGSTFNTTYSENKYFMTDMIEKYFKLKDYKILANDIVYVDSIDENLKIKY